MKAFLHSVNYWKVAFGLCAIMYFSTCISTFMAVSETWSDTTWREMGWFLKIRFIIVCAASGIPVIIAFLNKTMSRLEEGKEEDTQRWVRVQEEKAKTEIA
jgi:hypothetical protein